MKRITYFLMLAVMTLLGAGCAKTTSEVIHTPAVQTLSPLADESGAVKVYQGTVVTVTGINLDQVKSIVLGKETAKILKQTLKEITFEVPQFPYFEQSDNVHSATIQIFGSEESKVCYTHPYFITVPVTDALVTGYAPATGTVGTEITISGRNLEQITKIKFNEAEVTSDAFTSQTGDAVKFKAPAATTTAADNAVAIKAVWGGNKEIDVTGETPFTLKVPVFDAVSQAAPTKIGVDVTLQGKNLDLVTSLVWRTYTMTLVSQTATSYTFKVPGAVAETTPDVSGQFIATDALKAIFGEPDQTITVASAYKLDITPVGPAKPTFTSTSCADTGYTLYHQGRTVAVTGTNMENVQSFTIDGVAAPLASESTGTTAYFKVPRISGGAKKSVELKALYNNGETAFTTNIDVYPFQYTKGLRIRIGSNSASTYPAENASAAFLILDEAKVISVQQFKDSNFDSFALGTQSVINAAGKAAAGATAEQYYSVKPYYFAQSNSGHKLAFNSPANSTSQLKTHRIDGTSLPSNFGTPSVMAKIVGTDDSDAAAILAGTIENVWANELLGDKGAPAAGAFDVSKPTDTWQKGRIIKIQYANFAHVSATGGKIVSMDNVYQQGFIIIKDATCVNDDYTAKADRTGYIEFDLIWSNPK